jgi:hypothetical protein
MEVLLAVLHLLVVLPLLAVLRQMVPLLGLVLAVHHEAIQMVFLGEVLHPV